MTTEDTKTTEESTVQAESDSVQRLVRSEDYKVDDMDFSHDLDEDSENGGVEEMPSECPKCGCQVLDPFGMGRVIHDITHEVRIW